MLVTATSKPKPVGYLKSSRVYRKLGPGKMQLEIGRAGDVDKLAHLAWSRSLAVQQALAAHAGKLVALKGRAVREENYAVRLVLEKKDSDGVTRPIDIGRMSDQFSEDIRELWGHADPERTLRPPLVTYRMAYMVAVGTVGIAEKDRSALCAPFDESAIALAPVIKGFPLIQFAPRKGGRSQ
jgi:hypothetical protein